MKRLLVILLSLSLVLLVSGSVLAAVHINDFMYDGSDDELNFSNITETDTWFSVEPEEPYINFGYYKEYENAASTWGLNYYQNDLSFFGFRHVRVNSYSGDVLKGSFLNESGIFIGFERFIGDAFDSIYEQTRISPGYRFKLGESNYLAYSLDYDATNSEVMGHDLDLLLAGDNFKLTGETTYWDGYDPLLNINLNYQISDEMTIGLIYWGMGSLTELDCGITFTGVENLILDASVGTTNEDSDYSVSGMYAISENFSLGGEYTKEGSANGVRILKAKFGEENSSLVAKYQMNDPSNLLLAFEMKM